MEDKRLKEGMTEHEIREEVKEKTTVFFKDLFDFDDDGDVDLKDLIALIMLGYDLFKNKKNKK